MLAALVSDARVRGWPTPEWLASGLTTGDEAWYVYDFVEGDCPEVVDRELVDAILPVIQLQAGMRPETTQDWSRYTRAVVFANESEFTSSITSFSAAGAAMVDAILRTFGSSHDVELPVEDLVHGNFDPGNIVMRDAVVVGVIDVDAAGKGTRCVDIAGLVVAAGLAGEHDVLDRLVRAGVDVAGNAVLRVCVAAAMFALVAFGVQHWHDDVDRAAAACVDLWARLQ